MGSGWNRPKVTEKISGEQEIWFISDLHLGDGTPSDAFFGKDHHLIALLNSVKRSGGTLVIAGDAMDFHQAWTFTRILRAHQRLLGTMSELAREGRLYYVVGNHDYDISFYRDILNFKVCDELHVDDQILVTHGFEYDPYIGTNLEGSHLATKIHHLIERYLNTWIRVPLGEFYTGTNRFFYWLIHKYALLVRGASWLGKRFGIQGVGQSQLDVLDYWARTQLGDPMCMFTPIMNRLEKEDWPIILCGHSHLPGLVRQESGIYVNTGSWTFGSSQYAHWTGQEIAVSDWISGREYSDELYQTLIRGSIDEKDYWQWWRENYMGFFRFREGEERQGRLRGWESHIRDYQYLARLEPLHPNTESNIENEVGR